MIKKFIKPFMPLVLLFSVKSYAMQDPIKPEEESADCLINIDSENQEALRSCCSKKKCKCKKFCKLIVSRALRTKTLHVKDNATIGGNLTVTGNATFGGFAPKLCQAEQLYNLRGNIALPSSPNITFAVSAGTNNAYPITVTVGSPTVTTLGEGFTVSNLSATGFFYNDFLNLGQQAMIELVFTVNVTFDSPFSNMPTVITNAFGSNLNPKTFTLNTSTNGSMLIGIMTMPNNITNSGFTFNMVAMMMTPAQDGMPSIPADVVSYVNATLPKFNPLFIVEGLH